MYVCTQYFFFRFFSDAIEHFKMMMQYTTEYLWQQQKKMVKMRMYVKYIKFTIVVSLRISFFTFQPVISTGDC